VGRAGRALGRFTPTSTGSAASRRGSAIGETYAHLVHLERRGMIANDGADSGAVADGRGEADHWRLLGPVAAVTDLTAG
jgi:hypothetical protein